MKLNKNEVKILELLLEEHERVSAGTLAKLAGIKKSNLTEHIKKLEGLKLIFVSKNGRAKEISAQYAHKVEFLGVREALPEIRIRDILNGKMPFLIAYLRRYVNGGFSKTPRVFRVVDISLPYISAWKLVRKLRMMGVAYSISKGVYSIRAQAYRLCWFCTNILNQAHMVEAESGLKGIISMRSSYENVAEPGLIFETDRKNSSSAYAPTAYSIAYKYGVRTIAAGKYYYTNIKPESADAVIHMLAFGRDARSIAYAAGVMLSKNFDCRKLEKKAYYFGLYPKFIEGLIKFVETKGAFRPKGFPSWGEVREAIDGKAI